MKILQHQPYLKNTSFLAFSLLWALKNGLEIEILDNPFLEKLIFFIFDIYVRGLLIEKHQNECIFFQYFPVL